MASPALLVSAGRIVPVMRVDNGCRFDFPAGRGAGSVDKTEDKLVHKPVDKAMMHPPKT